MRLGKVERTTGGALRDVSWFANKAALVPELTRSNDIKLNGRVFDATSPHALSLPHRTIAVRD
jgi:hypothetical protein